MPLESATFINQLESANPPGTDLIAQADDHIRLIKATLKATFPNLTGAVTLGQDELNAPFSIPIGIISMWFGAENSVPEGWAICNGQTVPKSDDSGNMTLPDMRDRVPIGAGGLAGLGIAAGAPAATATTSSSGSHAHTTNAGGAHGHGGSVGDHAITLAQMPSHRHLNGVVDKNDNLFNHGGDAANPTKGDSIDGNSSDGIREGYTNSVGGGAPHNHPLTIDFGGDHSHTTNAGGEHSHSLQVSTIQPCVGIHFIMKI